MTNSIDPSLLIKNSPKAASTTGSSALGKDDFMKILITQLQNQDPLNPMDDKDFVSQMATFSSLEQLTNLNSTLQNFVTSQSQNSLASYSQLMGKEVSWSKTDTTTDPSNPIDTTGTGKIVSIQNKGGQINFTLDNGTVIGPGDISQVDENSNENSLLQASMLIGKTVTYLDSNNNELQAVVQSVSSKNGSILFQLNDANKTVIDSSKITKIE